jgi:single-strand DNA-binding protein
MMIIGNVGRDAEMRYTPSGKPTTTFSVATSRRWIGADGEPREETEWFTVITWNKLAEWCSENIQKGQKVYADGRLQVRSWEGQDGQRHFRAEITADRVILLSPRQRPAGAMRPDELGGEQEPDDVPF